MLLLFCSRFDHEALWLYKQIVACRQLDAEIFFQEDLYECKDWQLRLNDNTSYAAVTLPNGRVADTNNVSLFVNRVRFITHPLWQKKDTAEQQYFQQEWNAFMLGWLQAFEPVLLNKPLPGYLAGYTPLPLRWQILARQAGFNIRPAHFSSNDLEMDIIKLQSQVLAEGAKSILVFNYKVFAPIGLAALAEACINLAKTTVCKLMEIYVEQDSNGKYYFVSASGFANFSNHPSSFIKAFRILALDAEKDLPALVVEEELQMCSSLRGGTACPVFFGNEAIR